ncbi:MAG TPA: dihydrofolate reductase family protein [Ktedonobacteraceae bacterium]|jgi:dihydrofolate reductase|nr:dihydrofolate reductase family protein [Ktedonobacteraceae bacterium]
MRKVFLFMMVTLDGFYEGPDHSIDWHNVDEEFNDFAINQLNDIGMLVFGRATYELMASFWPTDFAREDDPIVAEKMNTIPKIVVSRTLEKADWQNTRLVKEHVAEEISELKQQPGKDIAVFGSSDLAVSLLEMGLLDELRIMVNPVVLGSGKSLFKGLHEGLKLKLLKTQQFQSGNVLLYYEPIV